MTDSDTSRRRFLQFLASSPVVGAMSGFAAAADRVPAQPTP